jgi:hypothetical protein
MDPSQRFPRLSEHFDVKHIEHDLHEGRTSDPKVYIIAVRQKRIVVTQDGKHPCAQIETKNDATGCIAIPPNWTAERIDTKLTAVLMRHGPEHFAGQYRALATDQGHPQQNENGGLAGRRNSLL